MGLRREMSLSNVSCFAICVLKKSFDELMYLRKVRELLVHVDFEKLTTNSSKLRTIKTPGNSKLSGFCPKVTIHR